MKQATHTLKAADSFFQAKLKGYEPFEIRPSDGCFRVGDYVRYVDKNGRSFKNCSDNLFEIIGTVPSAYIGISKDLIIIATARVRQVCASTRFSDERRHFSKQD